MFSNPYILASKKIRGVFRKIATRIPTWIIWNIYASTKKSAQSAVSDTTDERLIEKRGMEDATRVLSYISNPEHATALDLGCGIGRVAKYVAPEVHQLIAADIAPRMLRRAEQRINAKNVSYLRILKNGILNDIPNDSIDCAYSLYVMQHIEREDVISYFSEIKRVLKSDGVGIVELPLLEKREHVKEYVSYALQHDTYSPARMRWYTREEIQLICAELGFKKIALDDSAECWVLLEK